MLKQISGRVWFCCPLCGKKIHPVKPGARGVYAKCKGKTETGLPCNWSGEITYNENQPVSL